MTWVKRFNAAARLPSVGASLLAKNVNDNACFLNERGACEFFASKRSYMDCIATQVSVSHHHRG